MTTVSSRVWRPGRTTTWSSRSRAASSWPGSRSTSSWTGYDGSGRHWSRAGPSSTRPSAWRSSAAGSSISTRTGSAVPRSSTGSSTSTRPTSTRSATGRSSTSSSTPRTGAGLVRRLRLASPARGPGPHRGPAAHTGRRGQAPRGPRRDRGWGRVVACCAGRSRTSPSSDTSSRRWPAPRPGSRPPRASTRSPSTCSAACCPSGPTTWNSSRCPPTTGPAWKAPRSAVTGTT